MIVSENRVNLNLNQYDVIDQNLITSKQFVRNFGSEEDYVEYHIYSLSNNILYSNYDYKGYRIPGTLQGSSLTTTTELEFSPGQILQNLGYFVGTYRVVFNVLKKKIFNTNQPVFYIKEISPDRKELRITSNSISSKDIQTGTINLINEIQTSPYFKDFLINFGDNKVVNAVNVALDVNASPYSILVKLYQPLAKEFSEKDTLWFVEELSTPVVFEVELAPEIFEQPVPFLRSANFDIELDDKSNSSSDYYNNKELLSNNSIFSYQQLINKLNQESIHINVDYSDYSEFVHFSSARKRLLTFVSKLEDIEVYNTNINTLTTNPYSGSQTVSQSAYFYQNKIDDIIKNFDGYETYLYYESSSKAWPKSNSTKPYVLYTTTSSQAIQWLGSDNSFSPYYGGELYSSSYYDSENQNNLVYTIPEYLRIDDRNEKYDQFIEMIGHHFDNIWIYIKSITDLYKASNALDRGISKDLVYYALRSLGIKLYNSKANQDLYEYLIGVNDSGSYYTNSGQDIQKQILKRIYHNVSPLLKKKGTGDGLDDLISVFGIPSTILQPLGFGGADKSNSTVEYTYDRFSYSIYMNGTSSIRTPWDYLYYPSTVSQGYVPDSVEIRFKPEKGSYYRTSNLLEFANRFGSERNFGVLINPDTTKGFPYSKISLELWGTEGFITCSISLPLYHTSSDGENYWWNLLINRATSSYYEQVDSVSQTYNLIVANKIGERIGHQASASIYIPAVSSSYNISWGKSVQVLYIGGSGLPTFGNFTQTGSFIGHLQELRYWSIPLQKSSFFAHTLNPESIQGTISSSAYLNLAARYPLGNNLYTYNHYYTTSVYSVHPNTSNRVFYNALLFQGASFWDFENKNNYSTNKEEYVATSPNTVYTSPVTKKIRIVDNSITGSVLSPILRLEKEDEYRTKDLHFLDVSFSPQNEINKDIIANYGDTINIDEYIGDPRNSADLEYKNLININTEYYQKYVRKYNLKDYIRLIQFYDNTLFKMIMDFVPERDNLNTGITIKSPILERPKQKTPQASGDSNYKSYDSEITGSKIEADSIYLSGVGDGRDFYTGELQGSEIDVKRIFDTKNRNPYLWQ